MNPPGLRTETPYGSQNAQEPAGFSVPLASLRKRGDFLAARGALKSAQAGLILQARKRQLDEAEQGIIRVGFTCTKKLGNAVARNLAKRRLREIARQVLPTSGQPGWDYVLIGRKYQTAQREFDNLLVDLGSALIVVHGRHKK